MNTKGVRLGVDVGGTFTDLAIVDAAAGTITTEKVLTTPDDPSEAIFTGLEKLQSRGVALNQVGEVIHGTTLIINAIIERRGAKSALLATRGFRDIPQFVGRELRYDIYDPNIVFPEPLIPRKLRREVVERVHADGRVGAKLDEAKARDQIRWLLDERVESIAVCLLHSYLNPVHELRLREIIEEEANGLPVSLSHEVLPQIREYERFSATSINAYVQPIVQRYLRRLREGLREHGITGGLYLMTSAGGTMTADTAERFPIQLAESGPVAGALIAGVVGEQIGVKSVLSFDMGGTTAKSCAIKEGRPLINKSYELARVSRFRKGSGLPAGIPVVDLIEIGAGGGSIAEIDELGLLRVGPRSAGAKPGPVCYGLGGTEPTVTDANVVLGLIDPRRFLGGEMRLDAEAAAEAISRKIGAPLGLDGAEAAAAISRVVTESMTEAARVHAVEVNVDLRRYPIVAFGGAGPIHAYGIAQRLRIPTVICPPHAGVLSALGLLVAPLAFEFSRSYGADLADLDTARIAEILEDLEGQGRALLAGAGVTRGVFERSVDMCYVGQGFEVTTPFAAGVLDSNPSALKAAFDDTYEETYGRRLDELPARCVTWRVLASGPTPSNPWSRDGGPEVEPSDVAPARQGRRRAYLPEFGPLECNVYDRSLLGSGACFSGPALVEEAASTIVVAPSMTARVDGFGNLILRWGEAA